MTTSSHQIPPSQLPMQILEFFTPPHTDKTATHDDEEAYDGDDEAGVYTRS